MLVFRTENELNSYLREHGPEATVGEMLEAAKGLQEALGVFVGALSGLGGCEVVESAGEAKRELEGCLGGVREREPFKP